MYQSRRVDLSGALIGIPDGAPGIMRTLRLMRQLVEQGKRDPRIRAAAVNLIHLIPERDHLGEIRTLFEFVRDRIRYVNDVNGVETVHEPAKILELESGDCDDKTILLASLLESVGYTTRFVVTGHNYPGVFDHVYLMVMLPDGSFLPLDASEPVGPGWEPPGPLIYYVEGS
jgi:transglutaminase-like putative cysteine protease